MTTLKEIEIRAMSQYPYTRQADGEVQVSLDGSNWIVYYGPNKYSFSEEEEQQ